MTCRYYTDPFGLHCAMITIYVKGIFKLIVLNRFKLTHCSVQLYILRQLGYLIDK